MGVKSPHVLADSRRHPASAARIAVLGLFTSLLYGAGLASGGYAAHLSLAAVRASQAVPVLPWLVAFVFMVSGMLAVVYGFFFRPRSVEINAEEVALVKWDGKGRSLRRAEVRSVENRGSSLVLTGPGGALRIPPIFQDWPLLKKTLEAWKT